MVFVCKRSIYFSLFSVLQWRHLWGLSAQKRNTVTPPSLRTSYPNSQVPGCFPPLYSTSRPLCLWPAALVWIPSRAAVVRMAGVPSVSALQRTLVDPKVQLTHLLELPGGSLEWEAYIHTSWSPVSSGVCLLSPADLPLGPSDRAWKQRRTCCSSEGGLLDA